jgi:UDP-glucuronate decarboxylase
MAGLVCIALRPRPCKGSGAAGRAARPVSGGPGGAAAGMVRVMDGPDTGPFNIGNPTEFTMLELAKVVQEVVNPAAEIVFRENTADDPSRRKPDITKARRPGPPPGGGAGKPPAGALGSA